MWKRDMFDQVDLISLANSQCGRAPLTNPVQSQDRRPLERAGEKGTRGVAFMMVREDQAGSLGASQARCAASVACAACP